MTRKKREKGDVLTLWSHVWYERDIFITRDRDYHKKKSQLLRIGANEILSPEGFTAAYVS